MMWSLLKVWTKAGISGCLCNYGWERSTVPNWNHLHQPAAKMLPDALLSFSAVVPNACPGTGTLLGPFPGGSPYVAPLLCRPLGHVPASWPRYLETFLDSCHLPIHNVVSVVCRLGITQYDLMLCFLLKGKVKEGYIAFLWWKLGSAESNDVICMDTQMSRACGTGIWPVPCSSVLSQPG